jgi:HK97 family phage major capsid protein/HK97 family phage prohead protease
VINRAYGLFTIKSFDDDARTFTGIASTPTTDRMGDVVEPEGAQFKLPLALLHQHDSRKPVGSITKAKVTKTGIEVNGYVEKSEGLSPTLQDRLDTAWQEMKLGLVRGLSIGFRTIEMAFNKETDGYHFQKWEWMELSLVTIPANAEATITSIKSFDEKALAASGRSRNRVVTLAGVTAPVKAEHNMTLQEQLKQFQATRAAKAARMEELMTASGDEGRSLDEGEAEEYDNAESEVASIDKHLVRLERTIATQMTKAVPIANVSNPEQGAQRRAAAPIVSVSDNLPPGIEFARYAMCLATAKGDAMMAHAIAKARYPDQHRVHRVLEAKAMGIDVTKAPIAGGSTTHTTWAGPLVQIDYQFAGDFVEYLRPRTILGKFGTGGIPSLRRIPFNVSVAGQTSGGTGYWVGEGAPKPVTKYDFGRTTLPFAKVANIAVLTEELVRFSNPAAETLVRDALAETLIAKLDVDFVDPAKAISAGISPASITNGATPVVATGYTAAALRKDTVTLINKFIAARMYLSSGVWIMGSSAALNISNMVNSLGQSEFPTMSMQGGTYVGMPVIVSDHVATVSAGSPTIARPIIVLVDAQEIWLADDGNVSIDVSREASLQMETAPTNTPTGLGASPNAPTATSMVSMFQTDSVAIRAEREINWLPRRGATLGGQYITNASYSA